MRLSERLAQLLVRRPGQVLAVVGLVTLLLAPSVLRLRLHTDVIDRGGLRARDLIEEGRR